MQLLTWLLLLFELGLLLRLLVELSILFDLRQWEKE